MNKHLIKRELIDKPLNEIKPYDRNPRKNDKAVEPLAQSIRANGFNAPIIIDENGVILAGHTRHKAAMRLGLKSAPCIVIHGLSENQKKAYRIADNKINELAKWDFSELDSELADIDWAALEAEAEDIDWGELADGDIAWPDMSWDMKALGFTEHEAAGIQMDAEVGAMLDRFEFTSPVREREQQREDEANAEPEDDDGPAEESVDTDSVIFTAKGKYQDFGEDFWKLAGELYARGIKTDMKWGKK